MAVRTNYVTNPNFETNLTSWTRYGSAGTNLVVTRDTTVSKFGSASIKMNATVDNGSGGYTDVDDGSYLQVSLPAGNYFVSGWIKTDSTLGTNISGGTTNCNFVTRTDGFTLLVERHVTTASQDWTHIGGYFTLTATTNVQILFGLGSYGTVSHGIAWLDGVMIENASTGQTTIGNYFDGGFTNSGSTVYAWTGTANASSSTETKPDPVPAAPTWVVSPVDTNRAYVSWNAPAGVGITSFKVRRATVSGGPYTLLTTTANTFYDDTTVVNGTTYYYTVSALSNAGEGAQSEESTAAVATSSKHADGWYTYGVAPTGVTQTAIRGYLQDFWNKYVSYTFTQSGATQTALGAWRVKVPDQNINGAGLDSTVSEGIGYAIIAAVYMGNPANPVYDIKARSYLNGMILYYDAYKAALPWDPSNGGLMNWSIRTDGTTAGNGGATDGDVDAAFGMFMAHRLYGSTGAVNYWQEGLNLSNAIRDFEFVPTTGYNFSKGTATMTIASPCVVSFTGHNLVAGNPVSFTTSDALPTGITSGTTYYVSATSLTANTFKISATSGGSVINTSGSQSGTHTLYREWGNYMTNGNGWGFGIDSYYPDYFAPAWFRIFQYHSGDSRWSDITNVNYPAAVGYYYSNTTGGLCPDGAHRDGLQDTTTGVNPAYQYGYNSIRKAWRITLDYLWNGNTDAYNSQLRMATQAKTNSGTSAANLGQTVSLSGGSGGTNDVFCPGYGSACTVDSTTAAFAGTIATYVDTNFKTDNSYFGIGQCLMNMLLMSGEFTPNFGAIPADPTPPVVSGTLPTKLLLLGVGR